LRVHGQVIGSLNISCHEPDAYDDAQVRIAQDVADVLAPYLRAIARAEQARRAAVARSEATAREEMLRLGALRLTEGMERERQRIGMDLHDQTLADLTRLARRLGVLRGGERLTGGDLAPLEDELATCLQELRGIIEDTRPGVLQLFGFTDAVEALLLRSVEGTVPRIAVAVEDHSLGVPDTLPDAVRTSLYRIVQEAINNAIRHGSPRRLEVAVDRVERRLIVEVKDDGTGLDERALRNASGISHMRTRASLLSAAFDIGPGVGGRGTRVAVSLALADAGGSEPAVDSSQSEPATPAPQAVSG
jgi:signal transduction histidine kinase